ncbi:MAG: AraC family transcriptional regulator [Leptospiraceae bacterium]|nr:AraC family transcriptional regulator [Leptospiraceae bacterium]
MKILESIALQGIYFGAGAALLAIAVEIARRKAGERIGPLFYMCLALFPIQVRMGMLLSGSLFEYSILGTFTVSGLLLIGPLVLNMAATMIDFTFEKKLNLWPHFIPAGIAIVFDFYFISLGDAQRTLWMQEGLYGGKLNLITLGILAGIFHILCYFLGLAFLNLKAKAAYDLKYSQFVWTLLILPPLSLLLWAGSLLFSFPAVGYAGGNLISVCICSFFLFTARYPDFFVNLRSEIQSKRYESTPLTGIDVNEICRLLKELMSERQIFRDEELRLAQLADELSLTSHQLSRILNEQFQQNFNGFVNQYRVQAAEALLLKDEKMSVLNIAFEVGFNSKTTFNQQFLKITGMTPKSYRQKKKSGR